MTDARQAAVLATETAIAAKNPTPEPTPAPEPATVTPEATEPEVAASDPNAAADPIEDGEEEHEESAASDNGAETTAKPGKKSKPGVQKRFSELTKEKHEALRAEEAARAEAAYWREQAQMRQQPQQEQPRPTPAAQGKPTLEAFGYDQDAYENARDAWVIQQAQQSWREQNQQEQSQRQQQERVTKFRERVAAFEKEVPGGWEAAKAAPFDPTPVMVEAIAESEIGPKVGYYLSQHLDEARAISTLAPFQQAIAMGRIEAKLLSVPPPTPRTPVTRAPAPAPSLASGSAARPSDASSVEEHIAEVQAQRRKNKYG